MGEYGTVMAQIERRQQELGVSDEQLAEALGYKPGMIALLKVGSMRLPINKLAPAARLLKLDLVDLLRAALLEASPGLWEALEPLLPLGELTPTEVNLVRHVRKLAGGRPASPVVLDGPGVIALVVTQ